MVLRLESGMFHSAIRAAMTMTRTLFRRKATTMQVLICKS